MTAAAAMVLLPGRVDQGGHPVLRVEATVTRLDLLPAYVLIKATSTADRQPLTILSPRGAADSSLARYTSRTRVRTGRTYTFRLQATAIMKMSAPKKPEEHLFLNLHAFAIGKIKVLDASELPYVALNMQDFFLYH